ncbi:MAG: flagellar protein FlaG [Lachnospiraceae bacterium]|nr:flagellar protein FlaG [Lachnospiraceae bacterium]
MAIEPLSSAMTYQAQTTQQVKQQAKPVQKVVENMDVTTQEQNNAYDSTTVKVAETERSGEHENSQGNGDGNAAGERQQAASDQIKKAVEKLNKNMSSSEAVFGIHEGTNRLTIKIIDKESKEVLKELPPEKILDMIAKAWELAGIMVDEKG